MTMYKVYGIYESGSDEVLYIGSTKRELSVRFRGHVNLRRVKRMPSRGVNTTTASRIELFRRHRDGEIKLDIREISTHEDHFSMLNAEYEAIAKLKPKYNLNTGKSRPARSGKILHFMLNTNVGTDRAERLRALAARLTEERGGVVSITKLTKDGIDLILKQYGA